MCLLECLDVYVTSQSFLCNYRLYLQWLQCTKTKLFSTTADQQTQTILTYSYRSPMYCTLTKTHLSLSNTDCSTDQTSSTIHTSSVNWYAINFLIRAIAVAFSSPMRHFTSHKLGSLYSMPHVQFNL